MLKEETSLQNTALHTVGPQETFVKREKSHGQSPGGGGEVLNFVSFRCVQGEGPLC